MSKRKKLRKLGAVLLDIEPLYRELMIDHGLQISDLVGLIKQYNESHDINDVCQEKYKDGSRPVWYYGHKSGVK